MQALFAFVTGPDVLSSITGWVGHSSITPNDEGAPALKQGLFVLAAEKDVLCTPGILSDAAQRYRKALGGMVTEGKIGEVKNFDTEVGDNKEISGQGVRYRVVKELAHHLQNHEEWERGADEILTWLEEL